MDNTAQQPSPVLQQEVQQSPVQHPNKSRRSTMVVIIVALVMLAIGLIGGYLVAQTEGRNNLLTMDKSEVITPTIISQAVSPTLNEDIKVLKECRNEELNLKLNVPSNWSCSSENHGNEAGSILIKSEFFDITISNLGRGIGCPPEGEDSCKTSEFYKNELVTLTYRVTKGVSAEIYGPINLDSEPWIFVTYDENGKRELTQSEKNELISIIDSITPTN